jgi:glycosyltransferase involved in cell wall biosynthesis
LLNHSNALTVSLIIPIYNEAGHLREFLEKIDQLKLPIEKELIFVDDCSTDGSADILKKFPFTSKNKIECKPKNEGKGAALRAGFALASGAFTGVQDADFEYDPDDIGALLEPLISGKVDVVYGSRFKKNAPQVHRTFHYLINRLLTTLSNFMSGLYLTDMETCYKFFKTDIIQNIQLESSRFGFEPEVTAKIARLKVKVHEYPISYYPRNYLEGKKITWKDGVAAVRHIVYFNLFADKLSFFMPTMDSKYLPNGRQWL